MAANHQAQQFTAGDSWRIDATLLDVDGNPYDLTGATIKWDLRNAANVGVLDESDASISLTNAAQGQCAIIVASNITAPLGAGRYVDYIGIVSGGVPATLSYGVIYVAANPRA